MSLQNTKHLQLGPSNLKMLINNNQNKNRINISVSLAANQKAGIFFPKQQRTKQLEIQNSKLQEKINQSLKRFQQQNQHLKQLKTQNNTTSALLQVIRVDNQLLIPQNNKNQTLLSQLEQQKLKYKQKQEYLTVQLIDAQKKLFDKNKKYEQKYNLLQRYHEQIKNSKTLKYAPDSIVNVVSNLQRELQLLQRNITIHQNKLQGKNKYLSILQKKQIVQIKKQQKNTKNLGKPEKKTLDIYQKNTQPSMMIPTNIKPVQEINKKLIKNQFNDQKSKQAKKQNLKKYDQTTRKKNLMMMQKSTKKPV